MRWGKKRADQTAWFTEHETGIAKLRALKRGDVTGYGGEGLMLQALYEAVLELDDRLRRLEEAWANVG